MSMDTNTGRKTRGILDYQAFMVYTSDSQPDSVFGLSVDVGPPLIRRVISFLREHRWNVFASPRTRSALRAPEGRSPRAFRPGEVKLTLFGPDDHSKGSV